MRKFLSALAIISILLSCKAKIDSDVIEEVVSTSIMISKHELFLEKGENETLGVAVAPANTTDKTIIWKSSDTGVATVKDGLVTSVAPGNTEITAQNGTLTDKCRVTVYEVPDGAVRIGILCPKIGNDGEPIKDERGKEIRYIIHWAECNLGADSPEQYGDYFALGEVETYYSSLDPITFKKGRLSGYAMSSYKGDISKDDTSPIDLKNDAANVLLGGKWRIPTKEEFYCLIDQCKWESGTKNGVKGFYAKSKDNNNSNTIFFPAAGYMTYNRFSEVGTVGYYWSATRSSVNNAYCTIIDDDKISGMNGEKSPLGTSISYHAIYLLYYGLPIRPVTD